MVVCAPVWVELNGPPGLRPQDIARLLDELDRTIDFEIPGSAREATVVAYSAYAHCLRDGGGSPRRLMADFVIRAHALTSGCRLVTADATFYLRTFSRLTVVSPTEQAAGA